MLSILSTSDIWGAHVLISGLRDILICTVRDNKHFSAFIFWSWQKCCHRCLLQMDDQLHYLKLFWLGFKDNNYTTVFKHSLLQQQPHSLNRDWWQQPAAISWRLVFHWSDCINQGCLQREHNDQWWMTAGNYATARKHHTSHFWCADTVNENNPQSWLFLH